MSYTKALSVLFILFLLNINGVSISYAQNVRDKNSRYFILESNNTSYKVNTVKLNSKALYNIDSDIELFNVLIKDRLILFSVLPTKKPWTEIDTNAIKSQIVSSKALLDIFQVGHRHFAINASWYPTLPVKRSDIRLIVKRNGKFIVSEYCISEYFRIVTGITLFPNQMPPCDINILSKPISIKKFENNYYATFGYYSGNSHKSEMNFVIEKFERPLLFLSKKARFKKMDSYLFWLYDDWGKSDGYDEDRGIGRFLYVKDIGIIGGSFDFWFFRNLEGNVYKKLFGNYMAERVMYPTEINGKLIQ